MVTTKSNGAEKANTLSNIEKQALTDLINALVQKGFLRVSARANTEYEITSTVVPIATAKARIKEEGVFLDEYLKLKYIQLIYLNLYFTNSGDTYSSPPKLENFDGYLEAGINYPPKLLEVISTGILESNEQIWRGIYIAITRDTREQFKREELEEHIKNITVSTSQILHNFILLLKKIVQNRDPDVTVRELDLTKEMEINLSLPTSYSQPNYRIPNFVIEPIRERRALTRLLVVENTPDVVSNSINQLTTRRKSNINALILQVKTTITVDAVKNPRMLLEHRKMDQDNHAPAWTEPSMTIELPTENNSFVDAINCVLLWLSGARELLSTIVNADKYLSLGDYTEAISCYDDFAKSYPNPIYTSVLLSGKGLSYQRQGRYDDAFKSYDSALELDPGFADAWNNKGLTLVSLEKYQDAISCYDKALELDPGFADAWNNKGLTLVSLEKYHDAILCYFKAFALDPSFAENVRNELLFKLADKEAAANELSKAIRENFDKFPENVRNELLIKLADKEAAANELSKTIRENFDKFPENVRNELLIKLAGKRDVEESIASIIIRNYDKLPVSIHDLLSKMMESEETFRRVSYLVANNPEKLPDNVRNPILERLAPSMKKIALERLDTQINIPESLTDDEWDLLLTQIHGMKCVPIIGPLVHSPWIPTNEEIARRWAKEYGVDEEESVTLSYMAQVLAIRKEDDMYPKHMLSEAIKRINPPDFRLEEYQDSPYSILASLNLDVYITTNYDLFMENALQQFGKEPASEFCRWNRRLFEYTRAAGITSVLDRDKQGQYRPTATTPLVFHLFGTIKEPQSMVLTERDYGDFVVYLNREEERTTLPAVIRKALAISSILFMGYSLDDADFRTLYQGVMSSLGEIKRPISIIILIPPTQFSDSVKEVERRGYLEVRAKSMYEVKVYWGTISDFTKKLRIRLSETKEK